MATPTACEQAALDLADIKARILKVVSGEAVKSLGHADKSLTRFDPSLDGMYRLQRQLQATVDRCNGVRSRGRFIHHEASDL